MKNTYCILIPVYNHAHGLRQIISKLLAFQLPILLVNDGSDQECTAYLHQLIDQHGEQIKLTEHTENKGKGGAIKTGLSFANRLGFSHAVQVDADGQHDIEQMSEFISLSNQNPGVLISGQPVYDESAPLVRVFGRYLTHVWVWINSLSMQIKDSMCGYRVYPVNLSCRLIETTRLGDRMEFDTQIMVRWVWQGQRVLQLPTKVNYPLDGVSHFDTFIDNVLISRMHATMFFTMLVTWPAILWRRRASK